MQAEKKREETSKRGSFDLVMREVFVDCYPIDNIPKGVDIIDPAVLVLEIVSVLPNIET